MSTKELARKLGLLKRKSSTLQSVCPNAKVKSSKKDQIFSYIIVLDFESTCWKDKINSFSPEIIEFPAVLLNLNSGEIEDQFQFYVQPSEHSKLSDFCKELTGISQDKVDDGVPINTCIKLFNDWINKQINQRNITFPTKSNILDHQNRCIFLTWSDWDLNVCLNYECKRKRITCPSYLKSWIDLRGTYKQFYSRNPKGLNGALEDLGIKFEGREHSGIDDAKNTAILAWRMVRDGCVMKATKSLIMNVNEINENTRETQCQIVRNKENSTDGTKSKQLTQRLHKRINQPNRCSTSTSTPFLSRTSKTDVNKPCVNKESSVSTSIDSTDVNKPHVRGTSSTITSCSLRTPLSDVNKLHVNGAITLGSYVQKRLNVLKTFDNLKTPSPISSKPIVTYNSASVTPPLCQCGQRCKRKKVVNPGPNIGRVFFSCTNQTYGDKMNKGCGFFRWEKYSTCPLPSTVTIKIGTSVRDKAKLKQHYSNLFDKT